MDDRHFDQITRILAAPDSRRRLLGALVALPVVGGLLGILDADDAEAGGGRRKRRKKRHKHGKGRGKNKPCKPQPVARTCAGTCGSVTNNCKKVIDCGSCECSPACAECFTCQGAAGAPGACVPQEAGAPCGAAAACDRGVLQPQGRCNGRGVCEAASPVSCAPYARCDGDACAARCAEDQDCVAGSFCNGSGQCVGDQANGASCTHGGQCTSGNCVDEVCCDSACTGACHACNLAGSPGACTAEANGTGCAGGNVCCAGTCQACCDNTRCTTPTAPVCVSGTCRACSANPAVCTGGACCASDGSCQDGDTETACGSSGLCKVCSGQENCQSQTCVCLPDCEGKCGGDADGCNSTCPNPCPAGQTCLSNGSCAQPCGPPTWEADCPPCSQAVCQADTAGAQYCLDADGERISQQCATTATCPEGYYCYNTGVCLALCT